MNYTSGTGNSRNLFVAKIIAFHGALSAERTASVSRSNPAAPAAEAPIDPAKLSGLGGALAKALAQSDVRMDKVAALRQAIADGTYNVSASDVAAKIMGSLLV